MSKFDYEIVKYVIKYGEGKEEERYSEESAVEFARSVEAENPCIYQIKRMIMEDINVWSTK